MHLSFFLFLLSENQSEHAHPRDRAEEGVLPLDYTLSNLVKQSKVCKVRVLQSFTIDVALNFSAVSTSARTMSAASDKSDKAIKDAAQLCSLPHSNTDPTLCCS